MNLLLIPIIHHYGLSYIMYFSNIIPDSVHGLRKLWYALLLDY
jgi:hypothetical protein